MKRRELLKASSAAVGAAVMSRGARAALLSLSNPVLPQYDTILGQLARTTALTAAHLTYTWTQNFPFASGIPMAAGAPVPAGEQPAIDWLLKQVVSGATLLTNLLLAAPAVAPSLASQCAQDCSRSRRYKRT